MLGSAVALNLLFHIPLLWAVIITGFDVLLLLALQRLACAPSRPSCCCWSRRSACAISSRFSCCRRPSPSFLEMGRALLTPHFRQAGMIYVAIGIIGATVMPHNLYLHSALVQSRKLQKDEQSIRQRDPLQHHRLDRGADRRLLRQRGDSGAGGDGLLRQESVTVSGGQVVTFSADSDWIRVAYLTLAPLLGTTFASTLFAVALLASGQSSTITGTLAGQVVMEGFMHWRIQPWVRRLITRALAILPAVFIIGLRGDSSVTDLLTLSQVVLALQLPFAMFPLLHFTSSGKRMGRWRNGWFLLIAGWGSAILITAMDIYGLPDSLKARVAGDHRQLTSIRRLDDVRQTILVTVDGTPSDRAIIEHVKQLAKLAQSRVVLLHVADGWAARTYGPDAVSPEIAEDKAYLEKVLGEFESVRQSPRRRNWRTATQQAKSSNGSSRRVATWWP